MPNDQPQRRRIEPLDIYRCLFVLLAAFSHIQGHLGTWNAMAEKPMLIYRLLTRGATPGLLILFGVMMELVYVKYARRDGFAATCNRLVYRCLLCYGAFAAIAITGFVAGNTSISSLVGALSLLGTSAYANIFKLYLFLILAMIPLLALRVNKGTLPLLGMVGLIWIVDALVIEPLDNPFTGYGYPVRYIEHSLDFFLGLGDSWGPSIFHSVSLVIFGMLMANAIVSRSKVSLLAFAGLTTLSLALTLVEVQTIGWPAYLANIAEISVYRANNHYLYYSYGVVYSVLALVLAWVLYWVLPKLVRIGLTYIGSRTFEFFMLINLLIVATPGSLQVSDLWLSWLALAIYSGITCLMIFAWESRISPLPAFEAGRGRAKRFCEQVVRLVTGPELPAISTRPPRN